MKHFLILAAFGSAAFAPSLCEAQTFTPTKRVMIEDHTIGQAWFGWWSPRGMVYLEDFMLNPENSGYEVACIHGNEGANQFGFNNFDAMYLPEYSDAALNTPLVSGWPHFVLDRKDGASYETEEILPTKFDLVSEDFGYANLTIEPLFDPTLRNLTVAQSRMAPRTAPTDTDRPTPTTSTTATRVTSPWPLPPWYSTHTAPCW